MGEYTFSGCSGLISITIGDGVTSIEDSVFSNCSNLTSFAIGTGITSIDDWAFHNSPNLTSVTIGNGVTSIGNNTFRGNFIQAYTDGGTGTYVRDVESGIWTKQ